MPRLQGVSKTTAELFVRRKPNPFAHALWFGIALHVLRANVTFNFLLLVIINSQRFLQLFCRVLLRHAQV